MLNILLTEQISLSDCRCLFFLYDQKVKTKIKISWKELLRFKKKHLFIIFKGFSLKQIKQLFFWKVRVWLYDYEILHGPYITVYGLSTEICGRWLMYMWIYWPEDCMFLLIQRNVGLSFLLLKMYPLKKPYNTTHTGQLPCSFGKVLVSNELLFGVRWVLNFYLISIIIFPFTFCFGNSKNLINTV